MQAFTIQSPTPLNKTKFISKPLKDKHEIKMAQKLVYQVFVEEMGWIPQMDNPSGIKFIDEQDCKLFLDDFDNEANWFGSFHNQELIACWRFCEPKNGKFELENYHPIPEFLKTSKSLEVTRLAIHQKYRKTSRVMLNLTQTSYKYLCHSFDYTFAAVEFPNPGNLYLKLGLRKVDIKPFKYSYLDKNVVQLIYLDFKDQTTVASGYFSSLRDR
jgi:hypothetical protein